MAGILALIHDVYHIPVHDHLLGIHLMLGQILHVDLAEMLLELAALEVNEVHLEAGPGLSGAFIKADLVDELVAYTAPCFFGEGLGPAAVPLPEAPGSARRWKFKSADFVGGDLRMICRRN